MAEIDPTAPRSGWFRVMTVVLSLLVAVGLAIAIFDLDDQPGGLAEVVDERIAESGVDHPVTAVLLNFRSYDTWLEVVVLFLAATGVLVLRQSMVLPESPPVEPAGPVLSWLTRLLVPLAILTGIYLLWLGTDAPGGAFQAGAVLGAAGVLLRLAGFRSAGLLPPAALRSSLVAGFLAFLLVGIAVLVGGLRFLEYPVAHAGLLIIFIELLVTWSVAVSFVALFIAARPPELSDDRTEAVR